MSLSLRIRGILVIALGAFALATTPEESKAGEAMMGCATTWCNDSCIDVHTFCTGQGCTVLGAGCTWQGCYGHNTQASANRLIACTGEKVGIARYPICHPERMEDA